METMFLYSNMLFCTSLLCHSLKNASCKKKAVHIVNRLMHPIKDILLDTKFLAYLLWNSVLVNNDVHCLVTCKSL